MVARQMCWHTACPRSPVGGTHVGLGAAKPNLPNRFAMSGRTEQQQKPRCLEVGKAGLVEQSFMGFTEKAEPKGVARTRSACGCQKGGPGASPPAHHPPLDIADWQSRTVKVVGPSKKRRLAAGTESGSCSSSGTQRAQAGKEADEMGGLRAPPPPNLESERATKRLLRAELCGRAAPSTRRR